MTTKEPRLVWIEFSGDPSDDKEVYKRYSATKPFKPCGLDAEVVALVEASALTEALFTISILRAACVELTGESEGLKAEVDRLKAELILRALTDKGNKEQQIIDLKAKLAVAVEALDKASSHLNALYYFAPAHDSDGLAIKSTEKLCNEALKKIRSGGTGER